MVSAAVLVAFATVAHHQLGYWKDSTTLWSRSRDVTNNNWVAELNLGNALREDGRPDEAIAHFFKSAAINPSYAGTNLNIALYEQAHKNLPLAIEYYKRVVAVWQDPQERVLALTQMARAYRDMGDPVSAKECLAAAARPIPPGSSSPIETPH
jgi:tetratricopeptide (TPR) repeat protein